MKGLLTSPVPVATGPLLCLAVGLVLDILHGNQLVVGAAYVCSVVCFTWLVPAHRNRILVATAAVILTAATLALVAWAGMMTAEAVRLRVPIIALIWAAVTALAVSSQANAQRGARTKAYANMAAGIVILRTDGEIQWCNDAFAKLIKVSPDDLPGAHISDFLEENAWQTIWESTARLDGTEPVNIDGWLVGPEGDTSWVSGYANAWSSGSDRLVLQIIDCSSYRESQESLSESLAQFQHAVDSNPNMIVTVDRYGQILHVNPEAAKSLGPQTNLVERTILDYVNANDRDAFQAQLDLARKQQACCTLAPLHLLQLDDDGEPGAEISVSARIVGMTSTSTRGSVVITCQPLDEQLASEKQLRTTEARFSRIFHSSPDAILILRHDDGTIMDFNGGFTRLLGYTREDAIGQSEPDLHMWTHAVERERILKALEQHKEVTGAETKLRTKLGETVYVEIALRYIEIEGELCILCIGRDVSQRALAEAALKESQQKFEQVFSRSPDGIVIIRSEDQTICDINDAFVAASGFSRDDLVGASLNDVDVFANTTDLQHAVQTLNEHQHFANVEMTFRNARGQKIPALVSAAMLEIGEEPCVLCIAKDVRDLRFAEEQLRISEERFRGTFENAPIGILLLNMEGQIFQANRFAAELLDYGERSMSEQPISQMIPEADRPAYQDLLQRLAAGGNETLRSEQRMLCATGREIWTNMHLVLQRDTNGAPAYCIVQIADITQMKLSQRRMERLAFYDTLTNLANRRLFYDRLAHAIEHSKRTGKPAALLYLDLDQFKRVNDTLGHEAGDALLQAVSQRLVESVRKEDTVGRPGGDEFTVLLYNISTPAAASQVAEKVLDVLRAPITISGQQLVVTTSIGITIIPNDGTEPSVLMKNADLAMYGAKENGRNQYQFYSEDMNTNTTHRLRTEYELRRALERDELEMYYQPKIRLTDQIVVGVECLLRWQHPQRGLLLPNEFIDIAEETGAIVDIGNWVIESACKVGKTLGDVDNPICIAVNISSRQFRDPNLVSTVRRCIMDSGLNPDHLELEITETMLMHDVEAASTTLQQLHDLGVRLAIDDFGTGYSSLNYLKKFPIDTVKVDRGFVMDIPNSPDDMAITAAVIAMAHRLHMEVVAEGVETPAQLEFLLQHQCEYAQGFLWSRAVPLQTIRNLLAPNVRLLRGHAKALTAEPPKPA